MGVQTGSISKVSGTVVLVIAAVCGFAGCTKGPPKAAAIGEAFVGPAILKIRSDFPLQSSAVATVKHGDRLEIVQIRRKFLRVRTPSGAEGWTDERQLLAASDMRALHELASGAAGMPSQGIATTYATLNIHTQPALSSPSFLQLKEKESVEVLRSVMFPRNNASPRTPLIPRVPKKKATAPKKDKKNAKYPLPPLPKPPAPPTDWLELSKTDSGDEADTESTPEKPVTRMDAWSLVRTPQGQSGWVLTRLLSMAIPDEVAQYAEGRRIVSYFPLGETQDGDEKKKIWLWTTTTDSRQPWDFESFRVFTWSLRRHRYETAHIERNLKGYSPVLLKDVGHTERGQEVKYPGFSVCMEKKDGQRVRREYVLMGNAVRFGSEQACEPPAPPLEVKSPAPLPVAVEPVPAKTPGTWERLKRRWATWRGK